MSYCDDCIHKPVCYRTDSVSPSYADKCGDFAFEKTGHWIETDKYESYRYRCSECCRGSDDITDYCPNCGAKMVKKG